MANKILFCATVDYHFKAFHIPYMKWFKEQGWEVHVAASGELKLPFTDRKFNIPFKRSPVHTENARAYFQLKKVIDQEKYQLIHCHTPMGGVLARLAARAARKKGSKLIYTAHGFHFCKGAPLKNWLLYYPIEKWLAQYTDCLITINMEDYARALHHLKAKKIRHVHGVGVDTERFKPITEQMKMKIRKSLGYQPDDFLLFYGAEFNQNKNHSLLLRAFANIKEKMPHAKLLLAGEGITMEECKRQVVHLGIENMVDFLGYRNDVDQLLPICDAAVSSSLREGLPVNIMEAMACGLPVICSNNRGHRELVVDGENGYLFSVDNPEQFENCLIALYQNPSPIDHMKLKFMNYSKKYSLKLVSRELMEIYSSFMVVDQNESKSKYSRSYL
ncbi:glycosyltransferase EpsD [Falsibacillus pallidus]|uniref:Glycosyltransferase EpsD n=2 Tax=Falsibacillus pallidus TaxID=493781 RepID=A0A370GPQ2_9BACI|nr:glycosyltransferase EpsD [Falsibacillus pallidus]